MQMHVDEEAALQRRRRLLANARAVAAQHLRVSQFISVVLLLGAMSFVGWVLVK